MVRCHTACRGASEPPDRRIGGDELGVPGTLANLSCGAESSEDHDCLQAGRTVRWWCGRRAAPPPRRGQQL
ncbi:hypothetical protein SLNWT_2271 [Streptomyces albus]|uniref:Uncharacterized protein n=1 Tax=Streptomyces albus (strain ATCC 21838 / DSM 41398 / FERM P-419 / JCM 4703 / NBRC 107858) TaxID=1081613 RepID=A0A0B5EWZ3_STRA4|nr:hypothetical protein SLNWT_2271 [Streptomyces albus]AOU76960.1 hypothetical protein SLNHY_2269 [Streptomyces albus]AYN32735.1 hypothetical protein DUI70_2233 [Streptomyces albus]